MKTLFICIVLLTALVLNGKSEKIRTRNTISCKAKKEIRQEYKEVEQRFREKRSKQRKYQNERHGEVTGIISTIRKPNPKELSSSWEVIMFMHTSGGYYIIPNTKEKQEMLEQLRLHWLNRNVVRFSVRKTDTGYEITGLKKVPKKIQKTYEDLQRQLRSH